MNLRWHIQSLLVKAAVGLLRASGAYKSYFGPWRHFFADAEKQGLHILPNHYYTPIPDTRAVPVSHFTTPRIPIGFDLRLDPARELLTRLIQTYRAEFDTIPTSPSTDPHAYTTANLAYGAADAQVLYGIIRHFKPRRIIEIGSGHSTLLISQALRANQRDDPAYSCHFIAIEPYAPDYLKPPPPEVSRFEQQPLQAIPPDLFQSLGPNDLLFIDSSHVVHISSDVNYEYLQILPTLPPGVLVHIHDIFTPHDYPREWINHQRYFWNEQYLLEAFLISNSRFEVLLPTYALFASAPTAPETLGFIPLRQGVQLLLAPLTRPQHPAP